MFLNQQRIVWEYSRKFRGLPIYGFANAKVKMLNFSPEILELVGDAEIIAIISKADFTQLLRLEKNSSKKKILKFPELN